MFSWYASFIRPFLFLFDPEFSHQIAMRSLMLAYRLGFVKNKNKLQQKSVEVMGLHFPNSIGLAAGLDKNGLYVDALSELGFGFIEIGGVTPKTQIGNPKPRLFRLVKEEALINRMGFANLGIEFTAKQLAKIKYKGILGINLAKNKDTPNETAVDDYLAGFHGLWKYASYFTINLSSPNTPGLRDLLQEKNLRVILLALKQAQLKLLSEHKKYVPLVVKVSPDLSEEELVTIAHVLLAEKADGVIATNTTITREGVTDSGLANESGGLSGRLLCAKSTAVIRILHKELQGKIPIIASGGVMDSVSAKEKIEAGAVLLQVYTGFIYQGPRLIQELIEAT